MFANVKKITKPIQKQDFRLLSGEPVPPKSHFYTFGKDDWAFKYMLLYRAIELAKHGRLQIVRRVELKAELHKRFRKDKKVLSKTWHLASILERDATDPIKCQSFWNKVEEKLKNFELKDAELDAIRKKIEADVPRPSNV